jgi:hypothetical protein
MKAPRRVEVPFSSESIRRRLPTPEVSDESLFSWLLEMETQLHPGNNDTPKQEPRRGQFIPVEEPNRLTRRNLSRYIE